MLIDPAPIHVPTQSPLDRNRDEKAVAIEPVLLIHGTFANTRSDEGHVDWWHPGSDFCRELDALLVKEGSTARCWMQLGNAEVLARTRSPFAWSGANSELDRRDAGRALAAELDALEGDNSVRAYHLIGHSHGGNVILHALRSMKSKPAKLGAVIFMGTPVLSFKHREAFDMRWLAIPLYVAALGGGVWAYRHWPDNAIVWGTVTVSIALALIVELSLPRSHGRRTEAALYGSGYARAFVFDGDEAIDSLQAAQCIAHDPKRFVDQFTQSEPTPAPAFAPTRAPQPDFSSRMQNTGAYWLLEALKLQPTTTVFLPGMRTATAPAANPHSRAGVGLQRLVSMIEQASLAFPFKFIVLGTLWICVLLPLLIMMVAGAIYAGAMWLIGGIAAAVMIGGARRLGRIALPILVRKAVLGADSGKFVAVLKVAPGATLEPLSEELRVQAAAVSRRFGQDTGQVMLHAIANSDAFAIKSRVTDALTNTAIAHSYYYQAAEIKEKIAHLIAVRPEEPNSPLKGPSLLDLYRLPIVDRLKTTPVKPLRAE